MAEPVTIAEAKAQTNMVDDDSQDTFLTSLLAPARAYVERATGFFWVAATRTEAFSRWGDYLEIYRRPIASIGSVTYGADGTGAEYEGFQANLAAFPLRIYPASEGFPDLASGQTIAVTYTSGVLVSTSEEYLIGKRAMLLLIGLWFDNRGEIPVGSVTGDIARAVEFALDGLRPVSAY